MSGGRIVIDEEVSVFVDGRARARVVSWLASMSIAAGEERSAEGYLLELLALCTFVDSEEAARS